MTAVDMRDYQQLDEPITGRFDCSAYTGAIELHAHTNGARTTTGRRVRLASDEATPDPASPGLNLPQVDSAIFKIAQGHVDLDTRVGYRSLNRTQVRNRCIDGRWFGIQLLRGVLVARGFGGGSDFRGGHALTVHTLPGEPDVPIIGDPLVPHFIRASWDALLDAAEMCPGAGGRINTQWTRDLTPDYHAVIRPAIGYTARSFARFIVRDGAIVDSRADLTHGFDVSCTPPRYYPNKSGGKGRLLVQLTSGLRDGAFIDSRWAEEKQP